MPPWAYVVAPDVLLDEFPVEGWCLRMRDGGTVFVKAERYSPNAAFVDFYSQTDELVASVCTVAVASVERVQDPRIAALLEPAETDPED